MRRLEGKVALITGAAQGMGEAHARMFVGEGASVILSDVNADRGQAVADSLGDKAVFVRHDVTSESDWAGAIKTGEKKLGVINVLVNNAGVIGIIAKISDLSQAHFQEICSTNQTGVFLGMKFVIPSMLTAGKGSIINVSSISGIVSNYAAPNIAYVGSKFAVRGMSKKAAVEWGPKNIRVNSVHPGFIKTPMMAAATDEQGGEALAQIPLGRLADPTEVAHLMVFLASDESSYITGTELVIDGGMTAT